MKRDDMVRRARKLASLLRDTTPKPWTAFTDDSRYPPHTNIVSVSRQGTKPVFSLPGRDKSEPDVRLVAAAPAMASLLDEMADALERSEMKGGDAIRSERELKSKLDHLVERSQRADIGDYEFIVVAAKIRILRWCLGEDYDALTFEVIGEMENDIVKTSEEEKG